MFQNKFKMKSIRMKFGVILILILIGGLFQIKAFAQESGPQPPPGIESKVESRLKSLAILLTNSSVSRKVTSSGQSDAIEKLVEGKNLHAQAQVLHDNKQDLEANTVLDQVVVKIREAVKLVNKAEEDLAYQEQIFKAREDSIAILLQAVLRIAKEKNREEDAKKVTDSVQDLQASARTAFQAGRFSEAQSLLYSAFYQTKLTIYGFRNGETLENSVVFHTPEEEYNYEFEQNKAFFMYVFVLLDSSGLSPQVVQKIKLLYDQAENYKKNAQEIAGQGSFADATIKIKMSTRILTQAIALGGVFIPN